MGRQLRTERGFRLNRVSPLRYVHFHRLVVDETQNAASQAMLLSKVLAMVHKNNVLVISATPSRTFDLEGLHGTVCALGEPLVSMLDAQTRDSFWAMIRERLNECIETIAAFAVYCSLEDTTEDTGLTHTTEHVPVEFVKREVAMYLDRETDFCDGPRHERHAVTMDDRKLKKGITQLCEHASTPNSEPLEWHKASAVRHAGTYSFSASAVVNSRVMCTFKGAKHTIRRKAKRQLPLNASKTQAVVNKVRELVAERDAAGLSFPKIVCFSFNKDLTNAVVRRCRELDIGCFVAPTKKKMMTMLEQFRAHDGSAVIFMKTSQHNSGVDIPEAQYVILCEPSGVYSHDLQAVHRIRPYSRAQLSDTKAFIFYTKDTIEEYFVQHNREPDALLGYAKFVRSQAASGALAAQRAAAGAAAADELDDGGVDVTAAAAVDGHNDDRDDSDEDDVDVVVVDDDDDSDDSNSDSNDDDEGEGSGDARHGDDVDGIGPTALGSYIASMMDFEPPVAVTAEEDPPVAAMAVDEPPVAAMAVDEPPVAAMAVDEPPVAAMAMAEDEPSLADRKRKRELHARAAEERIARRRIDEQQ
jgi:hypothetical protein